MDTQAEIAGVSSCYISPILIRNSSSLIPVDPLDEATLSR